jgi:hypothetical protein
VFFLEIEVTVSYTAPTYILIRATIRVLVALTLRSEGRRWQAVRALTKSTMIRQGQARAQRALFQNYSGLTVDLSVYRDELSLRERHCSSPSWVKTCSKF